MSSFQMGKMIIVIHLPSNYTRTEEIHVVRRTHKHYLIHLVFFIIMAFLLGNDIYNQAPIFGQPHHNEQNSSGGEVGAEVFSARN